jgi:hypothetical protein
MPQPQVSIGVLGFAKEDEGMRKGSHMTEEQKSKIAKSMKGKHAGDKNAFYGKNHKPESIAQMIANRPDRHGENHPLWGTHPSEETRAKLSAAGKGRPSHRKGKHLSEEHRQHIRDSALRGENNPMFGRCGKNHPRYGISTPRRGTHLPDEWREKIKQSAPRGVNHHLFKKFGTEHPKYGVKISEESKRKLSEAKMGALNPQYGRPPPRGSGSGRGSWFVCGDGQKIWLRSTYEVRVARALTKMKIVWLYEPSAFELDGLHPYHPDFYLPEYKMWLEVKGWMRPVSRDKLRQFFVQYPNEELRIIRENDIRMIEQSVDEEDLIDIRAMGNKDIEEARSSIHHTSMARECSSGSCCGESPQPQEHRA